MYLNREIALVQIQSSLIKFYIDYGVCVLWIADKQYFEMWNFIVENRMMFAKFAGQPHAILPVRPQCTGPDVGRHRARAREHILNITAAVLQFASILFHQLLITFL